MDRFPVGFRSAEGGEVAGAGRDEGAEWSGETGLADTLEEISEALRPAHRREPGGLDQSAGRHFLGEVPEYRGHIVQPGGAVGVADELQGGRLGRGVANSPARRIELPHGHSVEVATRHELDMHPSATDDVRGREMVVSVSRQVGDVVPGKHVPIGVRESMSQPPPAVRTIPTHCNGFRYFMR